MSLYSLLIPLLLALGVSFCSYLLGQHTSRDMLTAIARVILQLLLLAYVLTWIFTHQHLGVSVVALLIMTLNAAINVRTRVKHAYPGIFIDNLASLALSILPLSFIGAHCLYGENLAQPLLYLPLLGMLLGNSLNGLSLGIDFFTKDLREKKDDVLSLVALGATPHEATRTLFNQSLRFGLSPNINAMISMGIVSIPGVMTGQLMTGVSPYQAIIVQIAIMLLVLTGSYSGLMLSLILARRRFFNKRGELCF